MKQDFLSWLSDYLDSTGREKLTPEELFAIEAELSKPKTKCRLETGQTEFPWRYESFGEFTPVTPNASIPKKSRQDYYMPPLPKPTLDNEETISIKYANE